MHPGLATRIGEGVAVCVGSMQGGLSANFSFLFFPGWCSLATHNVVSEKKRVFLCCFGGCKQAGCNNAVFCEGAC